MNIQKALAEFITFSAQRDNAISVIVSTPAYGQAPLYTLKTDVLVGVIKRCLSVLSASPLQAKFFLQQTQDT